MTNHHLEHFIRIVTQIVQRRGLMTMPEVNEDGKNEEIFDGSGCMPSKPRSLSRKANYANVSVININE